MLGKIRPLWWVLLGAFLLHQLIQKGFGVDITFVHDYIDPLLSIPIMLGVWVVERDYLFGRGRLTLLETMVGTVFLALVFELLFPYLSSAFTYDPWDFLAYGLGGVLFWVGVNAKNN